MRCGSSVATRIALLCVALGCAASAGPARAVDDFHAYLTPALPDTVYAVWGSECTVPFWVDGTARRFNAFELAAEIDPRVVRIDALQEGWLFVQACPDRFRQWSWTDSTLSMATSLLCAGVSVDGPGTLCQVRLYAESPGVSPIRFTMNADRCFLDAGLYVCPQHPTYPRQVTLHEAVIKVYDPTAFVPPGSGVAERTGLEVRLLPNIVSASQGPGPRLALEMPVGGAVDIEVIRADGARLRHAHLPGLPAGSQVVSWPWEGGEPLPAGLYFVGVRTPAGGGSTRMVVLR